MAKSVIKVQNLSKRYRLGKKEKQAETLIGLISNAVKSPWQNLKRLQSLSKFEQEDESVFWALKDVDFEVKEGEVLGIIGKNGAGKSTLLKILSGITDPSAGKIEIHGRIASLLEVGTGFHPELSGRENIYMNGTILGMSRKEIDQKLDEIIDFSGVEKFVNTPVKFYSSGMKVRLGFSVAAHLEPEILIIDEVLAVGDYEFQQKCLGKMEDVSKNQGRTVLFVSHNMGAVRNLCNSGLILENGLVNHTGKIEFLLNKYLEPKNIDVKPLLARSDRSGSGRIKFSKFEIIDLGTKENITTIITGSEVLIKIEITVIDKGIIDNVEVGLSFYSYDDQFISQLASKMKGYKWNRVGGSYSISCYIKKFPLMIGKYKIRAAVLNGGVLSDYFYDIININVIGGDYFGNGFSINPSLGVYIDHSWE